MSHEADTSTRPVRAGKILLLHYCQVLAFTSLGWQCVMLTGGARVTPCFIFQNLYPSYIYSTLKEVEKSKK